MAKFELEVKREMDTHVCPQCDMEFGIVLVQRPSKKYEDENPYCKPTWIYWSEGAVPPHCPFCGYKRQN